MKTPNRIRSIWLGAAVSFTAILSASSALLAQSQDNSSQSVAEAARKAKEQKKAPAKESKVITDDTIRLRPASADSGAPPAGTVVVSNAASDAAPQANSPAPSDSAAGQSAALPAPADPKKKEEQNAEVASAKEALAQAQAEVDVLKRELALDSDSYFSNPDYSHDTAGKSKLDDLKRMIDDKQISVEDLKRKLAELMQKVGISPDDGKTSAPPKN